MPARTELFERLCFAIFVACSYIVLFGYSFNSADQAEHLPQVYQNLNHELFRNDFFLTYYNQTFTIRFYWVWFVTILSHMAPVAVVCFVLYFLSVLLCIFSWVGIALHITGEKLTAYLTAVFIFLLFNRVTVGGNQFLGDSFVGSVPADALASAGMLQLVRERYKASSFLMAVAGLFQVLVGLHAWLLGLSILLFSFKKGEAKQLAWFCTVYLSISVLAWFPLAGKQFIFTGSFNEQLYYDILFVYRAGMHYKPSLFPLTDYLKFAMLLVPAVLILRFTNFPQKRILAIVFIAIITGAVVYTVLLEGIHINAIGKLQWFKTTTWLGAFCCLVIAWWLAGYFRGFEKYSNPFVYLGVGVVLLAVVLNGAYIGGGNKYQVGNYRKTNLQLVHDWVRENTRVDAMFLVSPADDAFACEAKRPQPVNYKAVVHQPFYFEEWYKRMRAYYHVDFATLGNRSTLVVAEENYMNTIGYPPGHPVQFRIDNKQKSHVLQKLGEKVYENDEWIITKVERP